MLQIRVILSAAAVLIFLVHALLTKSNVTLAGNESSRFGTIQALAEQNTFVMNKTVFGSVDRFVVDGRIYSDKPFMMMVVHAAMYKLLAAATGISFTGNYRLSIYLINLFGIGLLNIALFVLFFRRLDRDVEAPFFSKLFFSATLLLSTQLLTYGICMNNHTPAALVLFILVLLLMDYPGAPFLRQAFLIGITAGILFNLEIPIGGIFGVSAFLVVMTFSGERNRAPLAGYSAGALLPLAGMCLTNYYAIGTCLPQYLGAGGTFSPGIADKNFFGYFLDVLFLGRGFFSYMPALLFIVPVVLLNRKLRKNRLEVTILSTVAAVVLFYGIVTNEYGGWAYGFRYLIPVIPVIWYFIAREYAPLIRSWRFAVLSVLIFWGLITSLVGAYNPWCSGYEGSRSPPNTVDHYIRNTFAANLLCLSFEQNPDSALSRFMIRTVFGGTLAAAYLEESFTNTENHEQLATLRHYRRDRQIFQ